MTGQTATATLDPAPQGALLLEDQAGNPVSLWHPDMEAFDKLPKNVRVLMTEMLNPPPARNVLASFQAMGSTATMNALREIDLEDRVRLAPLRSGRNLDLTSLRSEGR